MRVKFLLVTLVVCVLAFIRIYHPFSFKESLKQPIAVQPLGDQVLMPQTWKKISHGIGETEVTRIAFAPDNKDAPWVSTSRAVYRSHGISGYLASLYLEGSRRVVHDIDVDTQTRKIYVATDQGLYQSVDEGNSWRKIYACEKGSREECWSILMMGPSVFLGTTRGLFVLDQKESLWKIAQNCLKDKPILYLAGDGRNVYASSSHEVYRFDLLGQRAEKIFSFVTREDVEEVEGEPFVSGPIIRDLQVVNAGVSTKIWLASERGIFVSKDSGSSWQAIPQDGIPLSDITSAAACQEGLYISSSKGAYRFIQDTWQPLYAGAETQRFAQVICSPDGEVFAATDKGVFVLTREGEAPASLQVDQELFQKELQKEPSIQTVHQMAIAYAEVSPEKIRKWRSQLAKKALLPSLSIGVDGDRNKTTSDNVYGSYTSGGQSYIGPDDKTFYSNLGWDVSLSWDLGDLVWSSDETSIDNRSKLMVELREDILNEATRLYFERRRLQMQILQAPDGEIKAGLEMQMRIDELTALIDALTGGEFSAAIQEAAQSHEG